MPITLTAPPMVVEGAKSYAEHSGMTLEALILSYLESVAVRGHEQGGAESPRVRALRRVADEDAPQWLNDISGVVSLPSGKSDDDLVYEAIVEKYGEVR